MVPPGQRDHKIEPEYLGPLADRPLAETARSGGPQDLFPGASAFLSARLQKGRAEQWGAVRALADRLLRPEEHVLYVAHAMEVPPVLHLMAMGYMAMTYHQVMLVFTDTRLIEVMLDVRGKKAGTRLRSFPWAGVRGLKFRFSNLALLPAEGRKHTWKVPQRGDRKLLQLLLARLQPHLLKEGAARAERLPLWHCPQCGAGVPVHPTSCNSCRASFRSSRLAAVLSLAFPGAGLMYAGHPFLGLLDFFGEVVLYGVFLMLVLEAGPENIAAAFAIGAILFVATKLESVHVSHILTKRTKPETEAHRAGFKKFALAGGLTSLLLIGGVLPLAGAARPVIDRDLEAGGNGSLWQGSRNAGEWTVFADDDSARSQWVHPSGLRVTLFAYPQKALDSTDEFRAGFRETLKAQGVTLVKDDAVLPSQFRGFRFVGLRTAKNGKPITEVDYFIVDEENHDLHQVLAAVLQEDGDQAVDLVEDLLSHAHWISAQGPERPAEGSAEAE